MPDKELICNECKAKFQYTEREQRFFFEKGFDDPKRCKDCRKKKQQKQSDTIRRLASDALYAYDNCDKTEPTELALERAMDKLRDSIEGKRT